MRWTLQGGGNRKEEGEQEAGEEQEGEGYRFINLYPSPSCSSD
jgi:hypothetical protein